MSLLQRWLTKLQAQRGGLTPVQSPAAGAAVPEAVVGMLREGNTALGAGNLRAAVEHYRAAVALAPRHAAAHLNLGYALLEQGDAAGAEVSLEQALALEPGADAHYVLGQARSARQDWEAARTSYRQALKLRPDFGFAWRDLGVACEQLGDLSAAVQAYRQAADAGPEFIDAVAGCARLQMQLGALHEALDSSRQWVARAPGEWQAHLVCAQVLQALRRDAEALAALESASTLSQDNPVLFQTRGNLLFRLERYPEAAVAYQQAIQFAPDWAEPHLNLGVVRSRLGQYEDALAQVDRALALQPDYPMALYNRTLLLLDLHRVEEALQVARYGWQAHPENRDLQWHCGVVNLLAGRFSEGWPAFEARWDATVTGAPLKRPALPRPLWRGESLQGKTLLLHAEQGLGDTLQLVRYVPLLERDGARILLWVPPSLTAVTATVSPTCHVESRLEAMPEFDYHCPLLSLPLATHTTLDTIPAEVPYLRSDPGLRQSWSERLGEKKGLRVGLVWSGNAAHANDRNRSIALQTFARIAVPGYQFVSLQNALRAEDQAALASWPGLRHFGEGLTSFADTAALADLMDLVISVDTSVAHLAGALARPLWLLIPSRSDWRWMLEREDSPWYPSARLFRQHRAGDWSGALERVRAELVRLAA